MKQNDYYNELISNIEKAINELENQIYKDLYEAKTDDAIKLYTARDHCRAMTWNKAQTMTLLEKAGLIKY